MDSSGSRTLSPAQHLLNSPPAFRKHVRDVLQRQADAATPFALPSVNPVGDSAVLFLLGCSCPPDAAAAAEPCLILNKRSSKVRQPGDLCCPGGSIAPWLDPLLSRMLRLPGSPLLRWDHWNHWRRNKPQQSRRLALLFATGLRESTEEMRLNPLKVTLLGPLPAENLVMLKRTIYPMVCWISNQKKFTPNWEVERIVSIPVSDLLDPSRYVRLRMRINVPANSARVNGIKDFACFLHQRQGRTDRLWGATFRIAMRFLDLVFRFQPPPLESLPTVEGKIDENYVNPGS